jgi:hypothetical protein
VDVTAHFKVDAPHGCHEWPFAVMTKISWSKNVRSMPQCPDQILMGSADWKNCVLYNLANYMEMWIGQNQNVKHLFTNNKDEEKRPTNMKQQYQNQIECLVWKNNEFKALEDETEPHNGLGTHSKRKFVLDKANKLGIDEEWIEYCGRWVGDRNKKILWKHYISIENKYKDAYVCASLCDGGAIKYQPKQGLVITDEFLFQEVMPNIQWRKQTDNRFCRVMGLARLWSIFDPNASELLPVNDVTRIRDSFKDYFGDHEEPVVKVHLEVIKIGTRLSIVPFEVHQTGGQEAAEEDGDNE